MSDQSLSLTPSTTRFSIISNVRSCVLLMISIWSASGCSLTSDPANGKVSGKYDDSVVVSNCKVLEQDSPELTTKIDNANPLSVTKSPRPDPKHIDFQPQKSMQRTVRLPETSQLQRNNSYPVKLANYVDDPVAPMPADLEGALKKIQAEGADAFKSPEATNNLPQNFVNPNPVITDPNSTKPAAVAPNPFDGNATQSNPKETQPKSEQQNQIHFPSPAAAAAARKLKVNQSNGLVSVNAEGVEIEMILKLIAEQSDLNIIAAESVKQKITVSFNNVRLEDALDAILSVNGYSWSKNNDIITVSNLFSTQKTSAAAQGRQVRVFNLNYYTAKQVEIVVKGLLSPVGQSWINDTIISDQRRTHEQVIVEDLPQYLDRIQSYISQVDVAPAQVVVEAHILQVTLKDDCKFGINFDQLVKIGGSSLHLQTLGFASDAAPTSIAKLAGTDLNGLINLIKTTGDTKALASPKLAVLNGQEARIQIGGKIGYLLTTTTQTSTLQSVNFLETGVILKVVPIITEDGQILMQVKPEVTDGAINPTTQLPDSKVTEVNTSVMLGDGESLLIGGLIRETDNDTQTKVPFFGDLWMVGYLFQNHQILRQRDEIVIALTPRIVKGPVGCREHDPVAVERATTKLLKGPLCKKDRTMWEPVLPDASQRPAWMDKKATPVNQNLVDPEALGPPDDDQMDEDSPPNPVYEPQRSSAKPKVQTKNIPARR